MPKLTSIFMFGNYELTNIKICKIMGKSGTNVKSEFEYVFCVSRDWWGKLCHRSLSSLSCDKCCNVACCRRGFCVTQPLKFRYIRRRHLLLCVTQMMLMMMAVAVTLALVSPAFLLHCNFSGWCIFSVQLRFLSAHRYGSVGYNFQVTFYLFPNLFIRF